MATRNLARRWIGAAAAAWLLAAGGAAQEGAKGARDLERILAELRRLPARAWQERISALQQRVREHAGRAAAWRKQAAELRRKADAEMAKAKAVEAEITRLRSLMTLVAPQAKTTPSKAQAKAKAAPKAKAKPKPMPKATPKAKPKPTPKPRAKPKTKAAPAMAKADAPRLVSYAEHVAPLLEERCIVCHDADEASGGLDMSSFATLLQGGSSGETIVPGDPEASRLYKLVARLEKPFMPKDDDPLSAAQVALIRDWIALGAPETTGAAKAAADKARAQAKAAAAAQAATATAPTATAQAAMPRALPEVALARTPRPPALRAMAASPGAPLVAVSGHHQIVLLHAETFERLGVLPFAPGVVETLSFSRDGRRLLAAGGRPGKRGGAVLYDVATGAVVRAFTEGRDALLAAALSPRQTLVALGGPQRKVSVYEVASGERVYRIDTHREWILDVAFSPDGNLLACADRAGVVSVEEADTGRNVHTLRVGRTAAHALAFAPDARALAVACADGTVRCFELEDGRQLWSQRRHGAAALALAWHPTAGLCSAGADGIARLWKARGQDGGAMPRVDEWLYAVAVPAGGARVLAGDWRGRLHVFSTAKRRRERVLVPTSQKEAARGTPNP